MTWGIYFYLTIELDHAKRDSRLAVYGGVVLQRLKGLYGNAMVLLEKSILLICCESNLLILLLCCIFCCLPAPHADLTRFWGVIVLAVETHRTITRRNGGSWITDIEILFPNYENKQDAFFNNLL